MRLRLSLIAIFAASPLAALTPLPPCEGVVESGMAVSDLRPIHGTGLIVELYRNNAVPHGGLVEFDTPPVEELRDFSGARVTHCASGRIIAFRPGLRSDEIVAALGATEFLRAKVQKSKPASAGQMRQAVNALYGKAGGKRPVELRETEETCGCNAYFPELRPKGLVPYAQRGT